MRYEHLRNRHRHSLRCDIFRYFPAIDHAVLKRDISRVKRCASTRELIRHIIDGSNAQEPVIVHLPGGDLFTPDERRRGLSIGNVASLLFGKVYLDPVDHLLKDRLRIPGYVHYVDDLAVFLDDGHSLHEVLAALSEGLAARRLLAHLRKTWIASTAAPATFLGFEVFANGRRRLPDENVARFGNRLRGLRDRQRAGTIDEQAVRARVEAWIAHARHADSWRLRKAMFSGEWFDPADAPSRRRQDSAT